MPTSFKHARSRAETELYKLWAQSGLGHLECPIQLPDAQNLFASSFQTGLAVQTAIGAAAASAAHLGTKRELKAQSVQVDRANAERECSAFFQLDGQTPATWTPHSGIYETGKGFVMVHANFAHHRDGFLKLLGLPVGAQTPRSEAELALKDWCGGDFETAAADAGLVVSYIRTFAEWDRHPQALAMRGVPPVALRKIAENPPRILPGVSQAERPLSKLRIVEMTRILAGPIAGRTLAAYGADVLLLNGPHLPNIPFITDTSRGKRSAFVDLRNADGKDALDSLLLHANVFIQAYRPGALEAFGLSEADLRDKYPGLIQVNLSAYGTNGPWKQKRGFDSLVQAATGFNHAEAVAASQATPRPLPIQALDYCAGFFMTFGACAALARQSDEGGVWAVDVSLLAVANWIRDLGRLEADFRLAKPDLTGDLVEYRCDHGRALGMPHAAEFSETPAYWDRASVLPGTDQPVWT